MKKTGYFYLWGMLLFLLAAAVLYALWTGSYRLSVGELLGTLVGRGDRLQNMAVLDLRLSRVVTGAFVGIGLSTAGCILQTLTKNDLADPGIIGINAGAAAAAVFFIQYHTGFYYKELPVVWIYILPLMAVLGGLTSSVLVYALSCKNGIRPKQMLLMGIAVNAGLNAFITFYSFRGDQSDYNKVLTWTSGSLWGSGWDYAVVLVPVIFLLFLYTLYKYKTLDAMSFSDDLARGIGVAVEAERRKLLLAAVLLSAVSTAFAGNIGFLGLIAPHMGRRLAGGSHKRYLAVSACISVIIIVTADTLSRSLFSPVELPVGIVISVIGVPYFLYLCVRGGKR